MVQQSLHAVRTLTTHSHPMSIVTAFGTFLAGQTMAAPRGFFLPARAVRVFRSGNLAVSRAKRFFIYTRGDGEAGPSCA